MWSEQLVAPLAEAHTRDLIAATRAARVRSAGGAGRLARAWDRASLLARAWDRVWPWSGEPADLEPLAALERVTIRRSRAGDREALERLAALDSARLAGGELLVAVVEGELKAALPVGGGRAIADPFVPTASLVSLLVLRAAQIQRVAGWRDGASPHPHRPARATSAHPATDSLAPARHA